jgi:hypothetical protein
MLVFMKLFLDRWILTAAHCCKYQQSAQLIFYRQNTYNQVNSYAGEKGSFEIFVMNTEKNKRFFIDPLYWVTKEIGIKF